jgi:hypothetical protein
LRQHDEYPKRELHVRIFHVCLSLYVRRCV